MLYLIYDGECILCRQVAHVLRVRDAVGKLEIINGRDDHPLVIEVKQQGYDLDRGMVVIFNDHIYYGKEALHFLAMVSSSADWFNKVNAYIFQSPLLAAFFYPIFKGIRRFLLIVKGVPKI
jgi:predicted DCC family thiol-disulfide oxidoreductase YuxK